eukprot:2823956-Karenia_brevis.AAC.1
MPEKHFRQNHCRRPHIDFLIVCAMFMLGGHVHRRSQPLPQHGARRATSAKAEVNELHAAIVQCP